jgi:hypothetical protein
MPNTSEVAITSVRAVHPGALSGIAGIGIGEPFDIVADVEIGAALNRVVDSLALTVGLVNLTRVVAVRTFTRTDALTPGRQARIDRLRFGVAGWAADPGDVLGLVASCRLRAGVLVAYGTAVGPGLVVG